MRNAEVGDLIRLGVYAAVVTLLAVCISPVLFQGGMALAEVSHGRPTNRLIEWFANWAYGAGFDDFFVLTFLGFAGVLFPLLMDRVATGVLVQRDWFILGCRGEALRSGGIGFLVVFGVGVGCGFASDFTMKLSALVWVLMQAIALAVVFEWVFRGVLFGALAKRYRPVVGVLGSAVGFSLFRLLLPPPEFEYADAESWTLGWEMLGKLPGYLLGNGFVLLVLLGWGVLLGLVRVWHVSLWPPVFLHVGWLVAVGLFDASIYGWISGLMLCAGFVWLWIVRKCHASSARD